MSYIVRTHHLSKSFGAKEIVTDVNLRIERGEIYGFLGPNGAGKTTVMRMLMNLVKPTSGEVELFGEKLTPNSVEVFKRIGSLIETPVFYDHLTAEQNLEIHCAYMGYHNKNAIAEVLDWLQLRNTGNKRVKEFSLGMKQRLAIARAIATKPELLILDEPINGLDPAGIKDMRDLFHMLSSQYRMTLLISSHLLSEIEQVANQIGIIQNGKLVEELSMDSLRLRSTDYIELTTPDIRKAAFVLENTLKISNFKMMDNHLIRIYGPGLSQSAISKALILNDVAIETINRRQTSLEEYFLQQTESGERHD
ncbi:ABC transporter ATP-binding protein [Paenibacillaceae bacterium]|nr:ABC transporter ATP-binding protein [Paenibacillaceae bacterium]